MMSILILIFLFHIIISSYGFQKTLPRQCHNHISQTTSCNRNHNIPKTRLYAAASNINKDGKCKFGTKEYWDTMYNGNNNNDASTSSDRTNTNEDGLSAEEYSWYCGYTELQPFWDMLVGGSVTKSKTSVLIAGIGNDITPIQMYDDGWTNMIAFDYSESGVFRAKQLFGPSRLQNQDDLDGRTTTGSAKLLVADCRDLPIPSGTIDATLDKGTLDAIYITGEDIFLDSVKELTRVTDTNGVIVCVSAVIPQEELLNAFQVGEEGDDGSDCRCWETILDGGLAFADSGEATIDLGASLYAFRRR